MHGKNRKLIVVFGLLLIANLVFFFTSQTKLSVSFDENLFKIESPDLISQIQIGDLKLSKNGDKWILNGQYAASNELIRLVMSILNRVEVKKPVSIPVVQNDVRLNIDGQERSFYVWGNPTKTKTYFAQENSEEVYEVQIPGYNEYLAGIFELTADKWRDRLVLNGTWRTIQQLTLEYEGSADKNVSITFDDAFFKVPGVNALDSNRVVDYLNQFEYFQANEWITKGRFPNYDLLAESVPLAKLTLETIDSAEPIVMEIFKPLERDRFFLARLNGEELFVIDQKRALRILVSLPDFELKITPVK
ncbi:MAG: hypothetical protein ACJA2C_001821 [Marinoscillum sp.]|jgi:hypothetical protein